MAWWEVFLLAFVEGATEFLPVSSTGHLILVSTFLGQNESDFNQQFNIIIQFGAIFSVVVLYWKTFFPIRPQFYKKLFLAFLPAAALGLLLKNHIDRLLGNPWVVAYSLLIGGIVLVFSDRFFAKRAQGKQEKAIEDLQTKDLLTLGLIQCVAFIPGVSRSAATILGGMGLGLSRKEAAEFSFFLAVPTLTGAAGLKTLKLLPKLTWDQSGTLFLGIFLSFIFALIAIRFFIHIVSRFGYKWFGVYRILIGLGVMITLTYFS